MDPQEEILRCIYPRIANLQEQVQLTCWSEHHLVPQDLLDVLPFGCPFRAISFYWYIDYQLVDILTAARHCTAYWLLSRAHNFDQTPVTQLSLFYDETFFWHYFVPSIWQEIITQPNTQGRDTEYLCYVPGHLTLSFLFFFFF